MKKLLFILSILAIGTGAFAQDTTMQSQDSSMSRMNSMKKDCYLMKDGKLMMMKQGDTSMMRTIDQEVKLSDGTKVSSNGTLTLPDGSTKMLKEGWYVDADGKMGKMKKPMKDLRL